MSWAAAVQLPMLALCYIGHLFPQFNEVNGDDDAGDDDMPTPPPPPPPPPHPTTTTISH